MILRPRLTLPIVVLAVLVAARAAVAADTQAGRWTSEKANEWYDAQPWLLGCNYIPSTAINQIETWQRETFDPATIDKELSWAERIGFNTVRIFAHDLVWEADPEGFKERLRQFLGICQKHDIRVIFTFFTNGCYGFEGEAKLGKQPDPLPGVHNSGWVQSPGVAAVNDPAQWGRLKAYVSDVITAFRHDQRIMLWDLYNEPGNPKKGCQSLPLLRETFKWARNIGPAQPLTACIEARTPAEMTRFLADNCDIITFHIYAGPKTTESFFTPLKAYGRPMICTEYMGRTKGSTFEKLLPVFKRHRIGAISFGLVAGKMNTIYPWGSVEGSPEPKVWFHDVFRGDGTPFDPEEITLIKRLAE